MQAKIQARCKCIEAATAFAYAKATTAIGRVGEQREPFCPLAAMPRPYGALKAAVRSSASQHLSLDRRQ